MEQRTPRHGEKKMKATVHHEMHCGFHFETYDGRPPLTGSRYVPKSIPSLHRTKACNGSSKSRPAFDRLNVNTTRFSEKPTHLYGIFTKCGNSPFESYIFKHMCVGGEYNRVLYPSAPRAIDKVVSDTTSSCCLGQRVCRTHHVSKFVPAACSINEFPL